MRTLPILLAALVAACHSYKTQRVDPGDDDVLMGTGLESADVEALSQMAKSLVACPALTGPDVQGVPTVAIHPVANDTRFDFDSALLVRRIREELVNQAQGRIRFISRDQMDEALIERERAEKRAGERTATKNETKSGVDYYLTGTASALSKVGRGLESDTIYLDFRLLDAETGELLWEKGYKTKKVGKAGVVYR